MQGDLRGQEIVLPAARWEHVKTFEWSNDDEDPGNKYNPETFEALIRKQVDEYCWNEEKGIKVDEVGMVVMTHLHRDHTGWNMSHDGLVHRPAFPKALYWAPKGDWQQFVPRAGMKMFSHIKDHLIPLEKLNLPKLFSGLLHIY